MRFGSQISRICLYTGKCPTVYDDDVSSVARWDLDSTALLLSEIIRATDGIHQTQRLFAIIKRPRRRTGDGNDLCGYVHDKVYSAPYGEAKHMTKEIVRFQGGGRRGLENSPNGEVIGHDFNQ